MLAVHSATADVFRIAEIQRSHRCRAIVGSRGSHFHRQDRPRPLILLQLLCKDSVDRPSLLDLLVTALRDFLHRRHRLLNSPCQLSWLALDIVTVAWRRPVKEANDSCHDFTRIPLLLSVRTLRLRLHIRFRHPHFRSLVSLARAD